MNKEIDLTLARLRKVAREVNRLVFCVEDGTWTCPGSGDEIVSSLRSLAHDLRRGGLDEANVRIAIAGAILAELITR